jgi:pimeloyl-ACP methyl ester carboxylesterase
VSKTVPFLPDMLVPPTSAAISSITPARGRFKRLKRKLIWLSAGAFVFWLVSSAAVAWKLSHRLSARFVETPPQIDGTVVEEHRLKTSDGETIGAWLIHGRADMPSVIVVHGIRSSRSGMLPLIRPLAAGGYGVLAISLRACGDSTGAINDVGWSARHDIVAAVQFLEQERPGRRIYICGTSMGAAAAVYASKELGTRVSGYVLDSPYRDLKTAVWNRVQLFLPFGCDYLAYAGLRMWTPVFLAPKLNELSPLDRIVDVPESVSILILSGSLDQRATPAECGEIYSRVPRHARMVIFAKADHSQLSSSDPERYVQELDWMFQERTSHK